MSYKRIDFLHLFQKFLGFRNKIVIKKISDTCRRDFRMLKSNYFRRSTYAFCKIDAFDIAVFSQMKEYVIPVFPVDSMKSFRLKLFLFRVNPALQTLVKVRENLAHDNVVIIFSHMNILASGRRC